MSRVSNQAIIIFFSILFIILIYLLAPILSPFLLGALLAYLLDPLVKKLDKRGIPHLVSVSLVFCFFVFLFLLLILMLFPLVQKQIMSLIEVIPQVIDWLQNSLLPRVQELINLNTLKSTLTSNLPKAESVLSTVVSSSYTIIEWIVNIVLTPVVTFYLLRDWDHLCLALKKALPTSIRPTVVTLAHECDEVLSSFFRGQLLVMLGLSIIYGTGLTLIGLKVGPIIGIVGGMLSIVPYLGSIFVLVASTLTTLAQFGSWEPLIWVLVVYLVGQAIEGYVLTPSLVGQRVGLHPVMVIFSIMAFGTLFGFFGILVAIPAAAVIKVVLQFINNRYHLNK